MHVQVVYNRYVAYGKHKINAYVSVRVQVVYHRYVGYGERKHNVFVDREQEAWLGGQKNSTKRAAYLLGITEELPPDGYRCSLLPEYIYPCVRECVSMCECEEVWGFGVYLLSGNILVCANVCQCG